MTTMTNVILPTMVLSALHDSISAHVLGEVRQVMAEVAVQWLCEAENIEWLQVMNN